MATMEVDESSNQNNNNNNNGNQLLNASDASVLEKYKAAGIISNRAIHLVLSSCRPGMKIVSLCDIGDKFMSEEIIKIYPELKSRGQKGICFPTCVSINEIAGHNSPYSDDKRKLHLGDMVKVDLGCHIDGFCAVVAHTIVLGECKDKKANTIAAAWSAAQSALRLLKVGNKNAQITLAISKSSLNFGCEPMDSVLSHEMRQYVIDHDNTIISKETEERKVLEFEFEGNSVFGIDIMMSSGRGKAIDRGDKCTIYKRNVEIEYPLKMKTSRELLKQINKQYPTFPFTMRNFEQNRSRLGITECLRTNIVQPYPILSEKIGEFVAQFKFTVIINPKATIQITGLPLDMSSVHPTKQIDDEELNNLLSSKFNGVLPSFYENIKLPVFTTMDIISSGSNDKKIGNQNKKKKNMKRGKNNNQNNKKKNSNQNKNRYKNQKNNNKNKKNNQNKRGKGNNNNQNKRNRNQNNNNRNRNNNQNQNNQNNNKQIQQQNEAIIMDLD